MDGAPAELRRLTVTPGRVARQGKTDRSSRPVLGQRRSRAAWSTSYAGRQAAATRASCGERSTLRGRQGSKRVEAHTAAYQYGAQTPSLLRGPGGQDSMRSSKSMPSHAH